jgi:hypothetical protein
MQMATYSLLFTLLISIGTSAADQNTPAASTSPDLERRQLLQEWSAFCDTLKAAGQRITELDRGEPLNTAEGFHYLAMLTGLAIERLQGYQVPSHPQVYRGLDTYKKIGLDASDNTYRIVRFEPGGQYRIRGWRGNSTYLGFQVNVGIGAVGNLNHTDMQFNKDGSFEVYLGGERRDGNWMPLPDDANSLYIREIFIDWETEQPSRVWIDRLDLEGPPQPLDATTVAGRFQAMGEFVTGQIEFWNSYVERTRNKVNTLPAPRATTAEGGSADNLYSGGYFRLADDEVMLVETEAVPVLFWSVQLGNNWFQSLDYQYRQTSLNSAQAVPDSDGRYRIVVSRTDPGIPNWLDTAGRNEGVIYYRWNTPTRAPGAPVVQVLKRSELAAALPANTSRITPRDRARVLEQRARDVARRFAL